MGIYKIYSKYIGSKLIVKLSINYSLIVLVSIFLASNVILDKILKKMETENYQRQNQLLDNMKIFTEKKYDKVKNMILNLYFMSDDKNILNNTLNYSSNTYSKNEVDFEFKDFIYGIIGYDDDILDVILIGKNKKNVLYSSSKQARSIVRNYDFSKTAILNNIVVEDTSMKIHYDEKPDYIIGSQSPVITFTGNLYNIEKFPRRELIGQYIINMTSDTFLRAYNEYSTGINEILLTDSDGFVLFSSENKNAGKIYPYYDTIVNSKTTNLLLEEESIVNWHKFESFEISIFVITPINEISNGLKELKNQIMSLVFICLFMAFIVTLIVSRIFTRRIKGVTSVIKKVQDGNLQSRVKDMGYDEIGMIGRSINDMNTKLSDYIEKVYVSEIKTKTAELLALQYRINPHFLNNTLELIRTKAFSNNDFEVADMLSILGRLFYWSVKGSNTFVTLEDEMEFSKMYLRLSKMNYNDRLEYVFEIDDDLYYFYIPKLLLQPILENSIQHGFSQKKGRNKLSVKVLKDCNRLRIEINDNGVGMDEMLLKRVRKNLELNNEEDQYFIGLSNVYQRIKLLYGPKYGLEINSTENVGTNVSVVIPAVSEEGV